MEFWFVDVPHRLVSRPPLGFEDSGLVIGDLLGRQAVLIGQRDSGVTDPPIENVVTMPAPFAVSSADLALASNREQLQREALPCNRDLLIHSGGPDDSCSTLLLIHPLTDWSPVTLRFAS